MGVWFGIKTIYQTDLEYTAGQHDKCYDRYSDHIWHKMVNSLLHISMKVRECHTT